MKDVVIDVLGIAGIVMLAYGLYLIAEVYMFIGIGTLFIIFALRASRTRATSKKPN